MIPIEVLRAVKRIIVHANCPDGRASALILHAALPDVEIVEMNYGEPAHENLVAEPGLLFCDFTPPKARLAEFAAVGAIVLDHHERALVEPFGERGVFGENEKAESGAVLAWREVYTTSRQSVMPGPPHVLATFAAIRDTWQRNDPGWDLACAVSEALRFVPLPDALAMGIGRFMNIAADLGPVLLRKKVDAAASAAISGETGASVPEIESSPPSACTSRR
jgi:hypothetical protein